MTKPRIYTNKDIKKALVQSKGHIGNAAIFLGIHYQTLLLYIRRSPYLQRIKREVKAKTFYAIEQVLIQKALEGEYNFVKLYMTTQCRDDNTLPNYVLKQEATITTTTNNYTQIQADLSKLTVEQLVELKELKKRINEIKQLSSTDTAKKLIDDTEEEEESDDTIIDIVSEDIEENIEEIEE